MYFFSVPCSQIDVEQRKRNLPGRVELDYREPFISVVENVFEFLYCRNVSLKSFMTWRNSRLYQIIC